MEVKMSIIDLSGWAGVVDGCYTRAKVLKKRGTGKT